MAHRSLLKTRALVVLGFATVCFLLLFIVALQGEESLETFPTSPARPRPGVAFTVSTQPVPPPPASIRPDTEVVSAASRVPRVAASPHAVSIDAELIPCARTYFENNFQQYRRHVSDAEQTATSIPEAGIDKVYVVHYTPMKGRRVAMTAMLANHSIAAEWVEGFDKGVLNATTDECFHKWRPKEDSYAPLKARRYETKQQKELGRSQRSVVIKHHSAIYDVYRRNFSSALVLEDDALLRANFRKRLAEVMSMIPASYDVVMIGGCMRLWAYRRKFNTEMINRHVYRKREARCAHAFVVSQKGARHLLSSLPLTEAIDFQMTAAMNERSMDVYWIEPWMSIQGPSDECVTKMDLGAHCGHSAVRNVPREFDPRFAYDTGSDLKWEVVPKFQSVR